MKLADKCSDVPWTPWIVWAAFWRLVLGPRPNLVAVYSDGKRLPVGFFSSWFLLDRSPHLLTRLTLDGVTVWKRERVETP